MTAQSRTRVSIELDLAHDPVTGLVTDPDGASHTFSGWLGLVAAIQRTQDPAPVGPDPGAAGFQAPDVCPLPPAEPQP